MQGHQEWFERGIGMIAQVGEATGFTYCLGHMQACCIRSLGTRVPVMIQGHRTPLLQGQKEGYVVGLGCLSTTYTLGPWVFCSCLPWTLPRSTIDKISLPTTVAPEASLGKEEGIWMIFCVCVNSMELMKGKVEVIVIRILSIFCYSPHSNRSRIKSHLPKYSHTLSTFLHFGLVLKNK